MSMDHKQQCLLDIYKKLYPYRDMLRGGPNLTFDTNEMDADMVEKSFEQINTQLTQAVAYLLGLTSENLSVRTMLEALMKHYKNDDFWRRLLLDYIEIYQNEAEKKVEEQMTQIKGEESDLYKKIRNFQKKRKDLINRFSAEIEGEKFPIDSNRLFKNYLKMADIDAAKAWNEMISNPAFFAPIIVEDANGNRVLSVADAKEMNKKIGNFIKKIKA